MTIDEVEDTITAFSEYVETNHRGVLHPYQIKEFIKDLQTNKIKIKIQNETERESKK